MTIVLNENEWAEEMIKNHSLGSKPFETLCRVAKYYIDKKYTKRQARQMLDTFLLQCDPTAALPKWSDMLDYAVNRAVKYKAIAIDYIDITKPEMKIIDSLEGVQLRRLAFTLLCLAKYWDVVNPNGDHWVNNKDTEIMKLANINTSIKRQGAMYHALKQEGLIKFSKKIDNTNVKVEFIKEGESAIHITDFRNIGYQYLKYHGAPYFECANCGITTKKKSAHPYCVNKKHIGRPQKYCQKCAIEINVQQHVNNITQKQIDLKYHN